MKNVTQVSLFSEGQFNTLAQTETRVYQEPKEIKGQGSDIADKKCMTSRAKRKHISDVVILNLIKVAEEREEPEMKQHLWNAWHCQRSIVEYQGRLHGNYCKTKICTLCLANRKADILNRYMPVISTWKNPCFLTLTIQTPQVHDLKRYVVGLQKVLTRIIAKYRKRHQRGKGIKLVGIKSIESNYNPVKDWFNPHFHIILETYEMGKILRQEWINSFSRKRVNPWAQDLKRITDIDFQLIELVKYGTKIFTEPDLKKKKDSSIPRKIYIEALYDIISAFKDRRSFDRFGFDLPQGSNNKQVNIREVTSYSEHTYDSEFHDWVCNDTGELLTEFVPSAELSYLLEERIDR